jgi:starch-binding outer membrane protein, SusD/RagB family
MNTKYYFICLTGACILSSLSCRKYLDLKAPATQLTSTTVFKNDATAVAAQLAIYSQMEGDGLPYNLIVDTGLSSDELNNYSSNTGYVDLAANNLTSSNSLVQSLWASFYKYIYESNAVLEGLVNSSSISAPVRKQLMGEAKFVRAFCHFYLVNLFGKVPLVLSTDYTINAGSKRSEIADVYTQIAADLSEAKNDMSANFMAANGTGSTERVRPTRWAAAALLARVYLYLGKWDMAAQNATEVINSGQFQLVSDLNKVFLKNSPEAIWQLQSVVPRFNTYPGGFLILTSAPSLVALSTSLTGGFEAGDGRYTAWTKTIATGGNTYYYPYKYKVPQNASSITEYTMVLRLAELYLIRAEANAQLSNSGLALADVNAIRSRAGLPAATAGSLIELMTLIGKERKAELFTEMGDRWLDLKRTGTVSGTLQQLKGSNWTSGTDELYPIPQSEVLRDPLLTQNAGY